MRSDGNRNRNSTNYSIIHIFCEVEYDLVAMRGGGGMWWAHPLNLVGVAAKFRGGVK